MRWFTARFVMLLSALAAWLEYIKDPNAIIKVGIDASKDDAYVVSFSNDSILRLGCILHIYETTYKNWPIRKRHHVFEVYADVRGEVPIRYKEHLKNGFYIGNVISYHATVERQKKAAISAFIDYVNQQLENKDSVRVLFH